MSDSHLLKTGNTAFHYYQSINKSYRKLYNKLLMLHYPFFVDPEESLENRQINLTKHCISRLDTLENKNVLEVGCGNGVQSIYIYENFKPAKMTGIDINLDNIELANSVNGHHHHLEFRVGDAQQLSNIADQSVDVLLCIESAFHYPEKEKFIKEVHRVLKPSGKFLIADILSVSDKNRYFMEKWKRKMNFHHWTEDLYLKTFADYDLHIIHTEDITNKIKQGYSGYSKWVSRKNFTSFFDYLRFKLFVFIQVNINIYLLNKRRKYNIFVGKPMMSSITVN